MQYIWDPEFDVIAAAIAKDARAAAAVEEVAAAAATAADEPAKLKNNNRNGALNWGIPENQSMMEIIMVTIFISKVTLFGKKLLFN